MSPSTTLQRILLLAAPAALFAGGCAAVNNTALRPVPDNGPVELSPNLQPLDDAAMLPGGREPVPIYGYTPQQRIQSRRPTIEQLPEPRYPARDGGENFRLPTGPQLVPTEPKTSEPTPAEPLVLTVTANERAQVGNGATFAIVARNSSDRAVENVIVEAEFDDALVFPGSAEKKIRRALGSIAAGDSREFSVLLSSETTGRHCARFTLYVEGREETWKEVCVEYVANELEVSVLGPKVRTVGNRAEFTVKLQNRAGRELSDVRLAITYDPSLDPREGSIGAIFEEQSMRWNLGVLAANEFVQVQVEFECTAPIDNTCITADVATAELPDQRKGQCLRVDEQRSTLQADLSDVRDPVIVGEMTEHVVTIRNQTPREVTGIQLSAQVPGALRVTGTDVLLDDGAIDVAAANDGDRVTFDSVASLPAGGTLTFRLKTRAQAAGDAEFAVRIEFGEAEPIEITEPISINAR